MKNFVYVLILIFLSFCIATLGVSYNKETLNRIFITNDTASSIDYSKFDLNDINAVKKATRAYQKAYKNKKRTKDADDEYYKFRDFYLNFVYAQAAKIHLPYKTVNNSILKQIEVYSKQYYKYGLIAQFDEGEYLLAPSWKYIYEKFGEYVAEENAVLLKFYVQFDKRIIYDGRYIIPKSELENYLKFYENFVNKYPEYSKTHNINRFIESYKKKLNNYPNL